MEKEQKQLIIITAGVVVVFTLWFLFIFNPRYSEIKRLNTRKQELLGNLGRKISLKEITDMQNQVEGVQTLLNSKKEQIYPQSEMIFLGNYIEKIGKDAGLKLKEITPDYTVLNQLIGGDKEFIGLPMEIEYTGRFSGISSFIDNIYSLDYYLKMNEFVLGALEEGKTDLSLKIKGVFFILNDSESQDTTSVNNSEQQKGA